MLSLFEISVPIFIEKLQILSTLLDQGIAHSNGNEAPLIESRLVADMEPLSYQIRQASLTCKNFVEDLTGHKAPVWENDETTFAGLQGTIAKTIKFLESLDPKVFDDKENADVPLVRGGTVLFPFKGKSYVTGFAIPNFYFHVVTAYALLRKDGVPIGKMDYFGHFGKAK